MKDILIFIGGGALFGLGACVMCTVFILLCPLKALTKKQQDKDERLLSLLEQKVDAILRVERAILVNRYERKVNE